MGIKDQLLDILEHNREQYISGQELAEKLSVSRNAIWKNIKKLQEEGHSIVGINNRGYRLDILSDMITKQGIKIHLLPQNDKYNIIVYDTVDSTNNYGKKLISNGSKEETIIISNEQTKGRGRMGREFYSPANTGVYMSFVLFPNRHVSELGTLTTKACVAVCRVIEAIKECKAEIKWVNDIYVDKKKVCGILTEAVTDFESGTVEAIVIGIGLNISTASSDFPDELSLSAGSVNPESVSRNIIVAKLINEVMAVYIDGDDKVLMDEYRQRCFLIDKEITYYRNGVLSLGKVVDVNDQGNLIIEKENGVTDILNSGEVTLSSKKN
ncbi:MAG: BirA family transcriptional regulator biotin operon repressor / biotin-acetyl-CoA-carboxylase ligase [Fusobacteria bacterium]|nr:MAG: BirA family transcriptional regulator biotin operon repressor / biotin-acetyl-CoA-carboxylase ligase [Fusobacteriota bacterium]KAF0230215.1 MAG: BirA family transcriptional regulator biotin operon repressor / biotin-acetyl-CoA-carboxylase [Fusobacteriota bacterium]